MAFRGRHGVLIIVSLGEELTDETISVLNRRLLPQVVRLAEAKLYTYQGFCDLSPAGRVAWRNQASLS